jgi:hypothetical protein
MIALSAYSASFQMFRMAGFVDHSTWNYHRLPDAGAGETERRHAGAAGERSEIPGKKPTLY